MSEEQNKSSNSDGFQVVSNKTNGRYRPNRKEVLTKVANGDLKPEDADKMLRNRRPPRFVVTRTGAVALYNLQRNPIILYADQWDRLQSLIKRGILDTFMERNKSIVKRRYRKREEGEEQDSKDEEVEVSEEVQEAEETVNEN